MYALETIAAGEASCLVVSGLDRLARSASDLGTLVEWFEHNGGRLVAVDLDLDTDTEAGQTAARALVAAGELDRRRLAERTKKGLAAARAKGGAGGRPAVSDKPALRERISKMRGEGMTLQAIADALNDEGVPTLRGGAEWRPSSVQAAAGYKRPPRNRRLDSLPSANGARIGNGPWGGRIGGFPQALGSVQSEQAEPPLRAGERMVRIELTPHRTDGQSAGGTSRQG